MSLKRYLYTVQEIDLEFNHLPTVKTFEYRNDASDYFDQQVAKLKKQFPEVEETALNDFDAVSIYYDQHDNTKYMILLKRQELIN